MRKGLKVALALLMFGARTTGWARYLVESVDSSILEWGNFALATKARLGRA